MSGYTELALMEYELAQLRAEISQLTHNLQVTEQTMREYQELAAKRLEEIAKYRDAPVAEHELQDTRCECCGYMTYHREHMGCIRSSTPQPDRVAELEAALKVARDAIEFYSDPHVAGQPATARKAVAKINEVLKP